ncbi:MAG: Stk1 family PASTA domain-containing Ser/Thr kinase [Acetatifactor sp.]|nr:Stk1 family PASTA domain-containing Ser/Thr kinase [Acetatifactor sp.]
MVKIGMMIGNRYEILEKIGTGGMSDVYKAKCHKLNRFVAVKVLKQEFSENSNFVSKFRTEAQSAAGLMHPNIVNVYDVGEDNGIYFIVMELVEGITLKKYIEKKSRLGFKESVSIAIQVCMGIQAAHNNHIIHRDIKPQNIIISKEGKVKVTDFGIAKAATSNTITSNVMGSVHYTSPEQARGGYSDEKSDVHSMGITLFEMLTGRVPFNGETTVAIAIKHIQEEIASPRDFVPEIPASVDGIVLKCCQKSPDRRYQNMAELIADLKQSLMNPDEDFVVVNSPVATGGTVVITEGEVEQIKKATGYQDDVPVKPETMRLREKEQEEDEYVDGEEEDGDDYDYDPKMERITTILAIVIAIIICIFVLIIGVKVFQKIESSKNAGSPISTEESKQVILPGVTEKSDEQVVEKVEMPELRGYTVENARNTLTEMGLKSKVEYEESDTVDAGLIISANVTAGSEMVKGSTVILTASAGPQGVEVPAVVNLSYEEAENKLTAEGFEVLQMEAYSDTMPAGIVAAQVPVGGSKAPRETTVTLTVSLGSEIKKVKVPGLLGLSEMDATVILTESKLSIGSVSYVYSGYPVGQVCFQSQGADTWLDQGAAIDIQVSQGPAPVKVTYKCNLSIDSPAAEDPAYTSGSPVSLKLVASDGTVLLETGSVTSFPHSANYTNLNASSGKLTLTYTVTSDPTVDEEGNTIPGESETKTITREVAFTVE